MAHSPGTVARIARRGAAIAFAVAWMGGCGSPTPAAGSTPSAGASSLQRDAAWGKLVVASPGPADANALLVTQDDASLILKVDLGKISAHPSLVTYIVRRTTGYASQAPGREQVIASNADLIHLESNAELDQFVMHVGYKRFFFGDYVIEAYADADVQPLGTRSFHVE